MMKIKFDKAISDWNGIVINKDIWYDIIVSDDTFAIKVGEIEERLSRQSLIDNNINFILKEEEM